MPARKYSVEQIIAKLKEMERLQGEGLSIPAACKRIGISDQTFYRARPHCGLGMLTHSEFTERWKEG